MGSCIRQCNLLLAHHLEVFYFISFGPFDVQGGVCIMIADSCQGAIVEQGVIVQGCTQWIILWWGQLRVGMLNIYAPNHASARACF